MKKLIAALIGAAMLLPLYAGSADAATTVKVQLISLDTPSWAPPTDARVTAEFNEAKNLWAEFKTLSQQGSIVHVTAPTDDMYSNDMYAVLPAQQAGVVRLVVSGAHTIGCYAHNSYQLIYDNWEGDCTAHEFGHIFGMAHSSDTFSEYGDLHSVMGSGAYVATYAQLRSVGLAVAPYTPVVTGSMVLREMDLMLRNSIQWGGGTYNIDYRNDAEGIELVLYTAVTESGGVHTTIQKVLRPNQSTSFGGYTIKMDPRTPTGVAYLTMR